MYAMKNVKSDSQFVTRLRQVVQKAEKHHKETSVAFFWKPTFSKFKLFLDDFKNGLNSYDQNGKVSDHILKDLMYKNIINITAISWYSYCDYKFLANLEDLAKDLEKGNCQISLIKIETIYQDKVKLAKASNEAIYWRSVAKDELARDEIVQGYKNEVDKLTSENNSLVQENDNLKEFIHDMNKQAITSDKRIKTLEETVIGLKEMVGEMKYQMDDIKAMHGSEGSLSPTFAKIKNFG